MVDVANNLRFFSIIHNSTHKSHIPRLTLRPHPTNRDRHNNIRFVTVSQSPRRVTAGMSVTPLHNNHRPSRIIVIINFIHRVLRWKRRPIRTLSIVFHLVVSNTHRSVRSTDILSHIQFTSPPSPTAMDRDLLIPEFPVTRLVCDNC